MLFARNAWECTWAHILVAMGASVAAGPTLVFCITNVGFTSTTTIRDFEETRFITSKVWRIYRTLRSLEGREEGVWTRGSDFLRVKGWGA